jgi:hypothetical protein
VEKSLEVQETPARERLSESEGLSSLDPSEEIGILGQPNENPEPPLCEPEPTLKKVIQPSSLQPSSSETSELKNMLVGMLAAIQQNNEKLQETVRKDLAANNESVKADISNVRADLAANNERVRADLAASQESVRKELNKIRKELKAENESLVKKIDTQNQQTKKELTDKIETESRRLSNLVDQIRKETETELLGAKRQLQAVSSEFETRTVQVSQETQILVEECRSEISEINKKLDQEVNGKLERQEENLNRENAKIEALENKVTVLPRPAVGVEPSTAPQISASPSVVQQSDLSYAIVSPDENRSLSCQTNNGNMCTDNNVNACRMHVVDNTQASFAFAFV